MRSRISTTAIVLLVTATGAALADEHKRADIMPAVSPGSIQARLESLGYDVHRVDFEHGAYEARIRDRASGGGVKVKLDPATGEIVRAKPRH
jgi:hypothetical protein